MFLLAYNKTVAPPAIAGFDGPTELPGAIEAPLDAQGHNTYMGYRYFPFTQAQGYDPQDCADQCTSQTRYNAQYRAVANGTYQTCAFFDAYVLAKNGVAQGLVCSLYNQTWSADYATNTVQWSGSDAYTVARSYGYSLQQ